MENQMLSFIVFILNGLLIGVLFDTFRILRKSFKSSNFVTSIQDIIFWILSGLIMIYSIFKFANGELRFYIFFSIVLGYILYLLIFSKIYIVVSFNLINCIKKFLHYTVFIPISILFKIINKIIFVPFKFIFEKIFNNLLEILRKIVIKVKKIIFKSKKSQEKKDFA